MSYIDVKNYRSNRKKDMIYIMGDKCQICGYNKCQSALEFHHINPEEKDFTFDSAMNYSWEVIRKELQKCILVCSNCHREIHSDLIDKQLSSSFIEDRAKEIDNKIDLLKHGKSYYCRECGAIVSYKNEYCPQCAAIRRRIVERPDRETLKNDIRTLPMVQVGRKYKVSDNAVRKWCTSMGLPSKKTEINNYTDEEWKKI